MNPWIDFYGSLLGALLAGIFALIVMIVTIQQTRKIQDENKHDSVQPLIVFCNAYNTVSKNNPGQKGVIVHPIENIGHGLAKDIIVSAEYEGEKIKLFDIKTLKVAGSSGTYEMRSDLLYDSDKMKVLIDYSNIYGKKYKSIYKLNWDGNQFQSDEITFY